MWLPVVVMVQVPASLVPVTGVFLTSPRISNSLVHGELRSQKIDGAQIVSKQMQGKRSCTTVETRQGIPRNHQAKE